MNFSVREASKKDFEEVYTLLCRLNSTTLSYEDWKKITYSYFALPSASYGYVLVNKEGVIAGFLGTLFSERVINSIKYKFCNIHSWVVAPEANSGGIRLLMKVLGLKGHVFTVFTASTVPYQIFKSLKFKELEYKNQKVLPFQALKFPINQVHIVEVNATNATALLKAEELQLFKDHQQFENVQFLWMQNGNESSFIISKRVSYVPGPVKKVGLLKTVFDSKLFLARIHYLRNASFFFQTYRNTFEALRICKMLGVVGLLCPDNTIPVKVKVKRSYYPSKRPYLFKDPVLKDDAVDTLYSEFFVLNF